MSPHKGKQWRKSFTKQKAKIYREQKREEKLGGIERAAMEQQTQKVGVLFFGLTFKQKTAQNFWVSLPYKLPLDEIRERIGKAFEDTVTL